MNVAIIDLGDKRLIPQIPWPLVQPLPIFVPMPTKKPALIIIGRDDVIKKGMLFFVLSLLGGFLLTELLNRIIIRR